MKALYEFVAGELAKREVRLSARRAKVLEYLCEHQDHPTVDEIYVNLLHDIPTLSKTTVYNTLHVLLEAGLVRELTIDDNQIRYDITVQDHGHLKCVQCGGIFNFAVDPSALATEGLSGFKVLDRNIYFKGICPGCLSKINQANQANVATTRKLNERQFAKGEPRCRKK